MIRAILIAEGSSDRVLCPILDWLLLQYAKEAEGVRFADFGPIGKPKTLSERISIAIDNYPCNLLFIHRDSDKQDPQWRYDEIKDAVSTKIPYICVVPIRMQEAWFFVNEDIIRRAAGCPKGRHPLDIPKLSQIEELNDPKKRLHDLLKLASGTTGRDARRFSPELAIERISQEVKEWRMLRELSAFRQLEKDTQYIIEQLETQNR
jgi:hypothetical protein